MDALTKPPPMSEPSAPESTLPYPPIHRDKRFVVLSDWCVEPPPRVWAGGLADLHRLRLLGMARSPRMIPMIVCNCTRRSASATANCLCRYDGQSGFRKGSAASGEPRDPGWPRHVQVMSDARYCYARSRRVLSRFTHLYRDGFRKMLASIVANGHTFEECEEILRQSACRVQSNWSHSV